MKIKLKDILDLYNFRGYMTNEMINNYKFNTGIISIYLNDTIIHNHRFVELGIYDYGEDEYKESIYKEFINENILNKEVVDMYVDEDINILCITLRGEDNESN